MAANVPNDIAVDPAFERRMDNVRARYFSRNPDLWPVYRDPGLAEILRRTAVPQTFEERLAAYPDGDRLLARMNSDSPVPREGRAPAADDIDPFLLFAASLSKQWNNPASVENVVTLPCDPAVYGSIVAMIVNPNLVCKEYSVMANMLEKHLVRRIALLAGYDPATADGLFTQGGTFCNMYGCLF